MRYELTPKDVRSVRDGFAKWVERFEELYYHSEPARLPVCTINIHSLLHIADTIEQCGPVWAYWCFAVERFCGSLLRTIHSRRFPFASLDKRVKDLAQLDQLKKRYNLSTTLDLSPRQRLRDKGIHIGGYPEYIFLVKRTLQLDASQKLLRQRIRNHLQMTFEISLDLAASLIPDTLDMYGKMERWEGGNMMHASDVIPVGPNDRDMTWVKYVQLVDQLANHRNQPPFFKKQEFYGQIQKIVTFTVHPSPSFPNINALTHIVLAVIAPCHIVKSKKIKFPHYRKLCPFEVVDVHYIEALVGRVKRQGTSDWYIVEREGIFARIQLADHSELDMEASRGLRHS
ncbi:hypothetical protein BOTBODRAFT_177668 [Botryobasidium botryosum FD-172 SS1]|uniref:Uncharacterized protein n=1 Tax=Botryobasidium botryosum (strain FD-172 SS1) TaxID=930990 RepID=A0A067M5C6_BOTB1|nr:hypothetical protein BOTBODRAFT_177668 [Botryobasidium botryosum FD-172 SS1]